MPKKKDETVLVLRTCSADRTSHDGFTWPEVGGTATAPDWDPDPKRACGGGLHGLLWGCGDGGLLHGHDPTRLWQVVAVKISDIADMDAPDKVRFRTGTVVFEGDRDGATAYLGANGATGKPIAYGSATAGDSGSATAGDSGTATAGDSGSARAGDSGTATAGDSGTATAGYRGTATAGYRGTATAGDSGTATAGHRGSARAGDSGSATAGDSGSATAGYSGTATAGHYGSATAGHYGSATAGYRGTATAGYSGSATAGYRGTARAGDSGTATAGYSGTATAGHYGSARAGDSGTIVVHWYDAKTNRYRLAVGYPGESGIEANVAYRCDDTGRLVRAEVAQ